ncbi:MAG TPA: hypothetical protein VFS00_25570 [Polyangiaceae bacterium]|nr:hypothetical protein [Polyangiaceae bacterium]
MTAPVALVPPVARRVALIAAALAAAFAFALAPRPARACGAAYPGGPMVCNLSDAPVARPLVRVGTSYAFTSTTVLFGRGRRADLVRHAGFVSAELPVGERGALSVSTGVVVAGHLDDGSRRFHLGPGFAHAVGGSYRLVDGRGAAPLVMLTGAFSFTHAATRGGGESPWLTAFDLRAGALVGKTIADVVTPYALGRAFGGPIFWRFAGEGVIGTDLYKYQAGAGVAARLFGKRVDAFVEGVPFGERGVAAGAGLSFF